MSDDPSAAERPSPLDEASRRIVAHFLAPDGSLHTMPTKRTKRLAVLDHICQVFELGVTYREVEVNDLLRPFHPDVAALRRYLVDDRFLSREADVYWRTGGSVDV